MASPRSHDHTRLAIAPRGKHPSDDVVSRPAAAMTAALYYLGLAIDAIGLLLACGNVAVMYRAIDGRPDGATAGLTGIGATALWTIPIALLVLMMTARALRRRGSTTAANVLLWLPALPFGSAMVVWGGIAVVFALFGR